MLPAMQRHGPDAEGIKRWKRAVLGHRRLSIFDLTEAGHQPMVSPDGSVGVVYNGAFYNFQDLRRQLSTGGFQFRSNSDTEILVHGYCRWGIDGLLTRLRGMFVFGL